MIVNIPKFNLKFAIERYIYNLWAKSIAKEIITFSTLGVIQGDCIIDSTISTFENQFYQTY